MKKNIDIKKSVENVNKLTMAFTNAVAKSQEDKSDNTVVSAYNAMSCLGMLLAGSDNNTKAELAKTLFDTTLEQAEEALKDFIALNKNIIENNKEQVILKSANAIWTNQKEIELDKSFAETIKTLFDGDIIAKDFSSPETVKEINNWASDNTNKLIKKIVNNLNDADMAVLASALYFKGDWTYKFDEKNTKSENYTQDGNNILSTETMNKVFKEGQVDYLDGEDFEAVSLTYGKSDPKENKQPTMRMLMIKPKDENQTARDWMTKNEKKTSADWTNPQNFENAIVNLKMPHIDIEQEHDLIPVLKDMGISDAFKNNANFKPMLLNKNDNLKVDKVTQNTVFKTDENGSELAAVTSVGMVRTTAFMPKAKFVNIQFDRSFAFALQDIKTGALIFSGTVNKPNKDMKPSIKQSNKENNL